MTTISVPLSASLEQMLHHLVSTGYAANKADAVRRALIKAAEDEAVERVLRAQREIDEGKGLRGDLRMLAAQLDA
ncbi:hypothetical protein A3C89_03610 [Candidatus Kaiserbacteria bacterium RIFCSPHIGHO2_02_FULL_50_50]|uniref:CopG family transcriptional regulator n=1 Tax=Candidatus Kaiserbacteria bacterium RIFCSPHIGHO2_02_FULL_50_50 TaxID=1798492 RepID=A0A1F6DC02_9BACT|nr:MAG: hypothetical protein A3C89_03610 [Candidatus Kaiserbacteria bacterium RIFCSPHIGHO2_02_FULL_50_50]OGG88547.1 MAG: hypothetical protein A3G62_03500 [Candidatus Kaiserbacteria bacterium RIFCSPLOWO2_12_FULL_50_10]